MEHRETAEVYIASPPALRALEVMELLATKRGAKPKKTPADR
jgi:hypothetical protein